MKITLACMDLIKSLKKNTACISKIKKKGTLDKKITGRKIWNSSLNITMVSKRSNLSKRSLMCFSTPEMMNRVLFACQSLLEILWIYLERSEKIKDLKKCLKLKRYKTNRQYLLQILSWIRNYIRT